MAHKGGEGFRPDFLKEKLEAHAVSSNRLSEEEIWNEIEPRSIDRFTKVVMGFIQHCRKLALTPDQLSEKVSNHKCTSGVEERFLNLARPLYAAYLEQLQSTEECAEDFDGLLQIAAELVSRAKRTFSVDLAPATRNRFGSND